MRRQFNFRIYFETSSTDELIYLDIETEPDVSMDIAWFQAVKHACIFAERHGITIKCIMEGEKL